MSQKPLLVAETIGWYRWREMMKHVNDLYNRRIAILYGQRYNYRVLEYNFARNVVGYFTLAIFIKNFMTYKFKAFIPKKYYQDQDKFDQMILDAANQRKYIQNIDHFINY